MLRESGQDVLTYSARVSEPERRRRSRDLKAVVIHRPGEPTPVTAYVPAGTPTPTRTLPEELTDMTREEFAHVAAARLPRAPMTAPTPTIGRSALARSRTRSMSARDIARDQSLTQIAQFYSAMGGSGSSGSGSVALFGQERISGGADCTSSEVTGSTSMRVLHSDFAGTRM